jgi:hypothetical protein
MSQEIYFYKLKLECLGDDLSLILKNGLKESSLDENEELQSKLLEEINLSDIHLSASSPKIIPLLGVSERILNSDSKFYFVDEDLWIAIKDEFFEEINKIKREDTPVSDREIYDKYLRKFAIMENIYEEKKLMINS